MAQKTGRGPGPPQKEDEVHVALAGPMPHRDEVHGVSLFLSMALVIVTAVATFHDLYAVIDVPRDSDMVDNSCTFSILSAGGSELFCTVGSSVYHVDVSADHEKNMIIAIIGFSLCALGFLVQLINFALGMGGSRNAALHYFCEPLYFVTGYVQMSLGQLSDSWSIWSEPTRVRGAGTTDTNLRVMPLFSGLTNMSVVLCFWVVVLAHVGYRAPGPLSLNTRFMHIYDVKEEVPQGPGSMGLTKADLEGPTRPPREGVAKGLFGFAASAEAERRGSTPV